jgi:hypothetical protein
MQRSYLDQYGDGEEQRAKITRIIIRSVVAVLLTALVSSFLWYIFRNHHQEAVVRSFIAAVKSGDFKTAYQVWGCAQEKPCSGYEFDKFLSDWSPKSTVSSGPPDLNVLRLTDSESCNNGVLLTLTVNPNRVEKLWIDKRSDSMSYAPYPICPHKNPYAIMLHRTIGKLRKPLL